MTALDTFAVVKVVGPVTFNAELKEAVCPTILAFRLHSVSSKPKSPVLPPEASVCPIINISAPSSQPINTFCDEPLSIIKPLSCVGASVEDNPWDNSIKASLTAVLVVLIVVVVPFTVKSPDTVTLLLKVAALVTFSVELNVADSVTVNVLA